MRTELFEFELPPELIAQHPIRPRDAARLLVVGETGLEDRRVADLPALLEPGDLLVFNDTRVIPARLIGRRGAATVEVTLQEPVGSPEAIAGAVELRRAGAALWRAFARPARRLRVGERLQFGPDLAAEVRTKGEGGEVTLAFGCTDEVLLERLRAVGQMPLPPYIKRPQER